MWSVNPSRTRGRIPARCHCSRLSSQAWSSAAGCMAERSSSGRLDPPLTLILDDVAAVAPFAQLPDLLADGRDRGLPTLALLRSREQARTRWPHHELPV